jgi:hypothetical protein
MGFLLLANIQITTVKFGSQLSKHVKTIPQRMVVIQRLHNSRAILHSKTVFHSQQRLSVTVSHNELKTATYSDLTVAH